MVINMNHPSVVQPRRHHDGAVRTHQLVGRITLVGAGPGGADLITLRGARAIESADVVLYDRLADPELLDLAPAHADLVCVGKGKGFGPHQSSIGSLMVGRANKGAHVVRLKGGDPSVFGRCSEELTAAHEANIPVEVVPGISSALAAPALAGISLTDRRFASGFTVISGHRVTSEYDWVALVRSATTVVVLMASTTAHLVASRLVAAGASTSQSVAFVHAAGTPRQNVVTTTLRATCEHGCPFDSPVVMVVGEAASPEHRHQPLSI